MTTAVIVMMGLLPLKASAASGELADWFLYLYSNTHGLNGDAGQFKTTDTPNVLTIEAVDITASGVNFSVHNQSWSTQYGWSDAGGSVTATGIDYKLGAATSASGWLAIPTGCYDVTFNTAELTIRFDVHVAGETVEGLTWVDGDIVRWKSDNSEVRLFGASYCLPSACDYRAANYVGLTSLEQKKAMIDEDMEHFRRMRFNGMRLSFYGDYENSDANGNLVDNEHLQLLCYLIKVASEKGIYMMLTPIIGYDSRWPENEKVGYTDDGGSGFARKAGYEKWQLLYTNQSAHNVAKNYLTQLLNYTNPFTGHQLKVEPNILFLELVNEPNYQNPSANTSAYLATMNSLASAVKATGCNKLIMMNTSQDFHVASIVGSSQVDGGTYAWYPQNISMGYRREGNSLPWVSSYNQMGYAYPTAKARAVYEFDSADRADGYTIAQMTKSLREAGMQFASIYAYDPLRIAPYNVSNRTHFFNMVYTPQKAVSAMIAAEVMRQGADKLTIDAVDELSVLADDTHFYYSGNTMTAPAATVTAIAGCGSSPAANYDGTGIYFLDRQADGSWSLEVYPDIDELSDPFSTLGNLSSITKPAVVCKSSYAAHTLSVNLPGGVQGRFSITPGKYVIAANGSLSAVTPLPAEAFYQSITGTVPAPAVAYGDSNYEKTVTLFNTGATPWDQWNRVCGSREWHSPKTSLTKNGAAPYAFDLTVSTLADNSDYTSYGYYPDATLSVYVGDRVSGTFTNPTFTVNAKGLNGNTSALFIVVMSDGTAFGKTITLSANYVDINVAASELQPVRAAMLPQDWPGVCSYWFPASASNSVAAIDFSKLERVQLAMRKELYAANQLNVARGVSLASVIMKGTAQLSLKDDVLSAPVYAEGYYDLTLDRTFQANEWNTLCLPVSLSKQQIEECFGAGTKVAAFASVDDGKVNFSEVNSIESNKPYLIKPAQTAMKPIGNVMVESFSPVAVANNGFSFVGTNRCQMVPADGYVIGNDVQKSTVESFVKGTNAFFKAENVSVARLSLYVDGESASIEGVRLDNNSVAPVYNLQGQCVGSEHSNLPVGVYIINKKKVMRK